MFTNAQALGCSRSSMRTRTKYTASGVFHSTQPMTPALVPLKPHSAGKSHLHENSLRRTMSKAFTLVREENIPEINSIAKLYVHKRTGARLLSIINEDENKVFGIRRLPFHTADDTCPGTA